MGCSSTGFLKNHFYVQSLSDHVYYQNIWLNLLSAPISQFIFLFIILLVHYKCIGIFSKMRFFSFLCRTIINTLLMPPYRGGGVWVLKWPYSTYAAWGIMPLVGRVVPYPFDKVILRTFMLLGMAQPGPHPGDASTSWAQPKRVMWTALLWVFHPQKET